MRVQTTLYRDWSIAFGASKHFVQLSGHVDGEHGSVAALVQPPVSTATELISVSYYVVQLYSISLLTLKITCESAGIGKTPDEARELK